MMGLAIGLFATALFGWAILRIIKAKALDIWLMPYITRTIRPRESPSPGFPVDVMFSIVDHFEPKYVKQDSYGHATCMTTREDETAVVNEWVDRYPKMAAAYKDSDGLSPRHTWCYPIENFDSSHVGKLAELCRQGFGEIEVHLHHFHDTSKGLEKTLEIGKKQLAAYGATVSVGSQSTQRFAFVHGNWSLDNAGGNETCGVNDELEILRRAGCFADFTLPSAPSRTQTRKINSIYYAYDDTRKPKSHDTGIDVAVGEREQGTLMIIQGPLCVNWKKRKFGIFPAIENGELHPNNPVTPQRVRLWLKAAVHVKGQPNWIFIKVHCHGGVRRDLEFFLGEQAHKLHATLASEMRNIARHRLHYVTAREMYNIIKAAEDGKQGNPHEYRDYRIAPYLNSDFRGATESLCSEAH